MYRTPEEMRLINAAFEHFELKRQMNVISDASEIKKIYTKKTNLDLEEVAEEIGIRLDKTCGVLGEMITCNYCEGTKKNKKGEECTRCMGRGRITVGLALDWVIV